MISQSQREAAGTTFKDLVEELNKESVRGAMLLGTAWIDDQLTELLKAKLLIPANSNQDRLLDRSEPLGDFGPKIELSYRLGLIRRESYDSLKIIRTLRNDFAHRRDPISLETQSVKDRVKRLYDLNGELLKSVDEVVHKVVDMKRHLVIDPDSYSLPDSFRLNFLIALVSTGLEYATSQVSRIDEP
jgi:DNA-binding MltR family transcriptional regulator